MPKLTLKQLVEEGDLVPAKTDKSTPTIKSVPKPSPQPPQPRIETPQPRKSKVSRNAHILNRENMIRFVTAKGTMKKVEANWFFLPTPARQVSDLIDQLLSEGVFKRIKHGWIVITE